MAVAIALDPCTGSRRRAVLHVLHTALRLVVDHDLEVEDVLHEVVGDLPIMASNMSKPSRCHSESGSCWPIARRLMPSWR